MMLTALPVSTRIFEMMVPASSSVITKAIVVGHIELDGFVFVES